MAVKITGPKYLIGPTLPNTSPNPIFPLVTYLSIRAVGRDSRLNVDVVGDQAEIEGIEDLSDLPVSLVASLVAMGAEIHNYPAWIEVDDLEADVPEGVPNRLDGEGTVLKWSEWCDESHSPTTIDGVAYVPSNGSNGVDLPGSVLAALVAASIPVKSLMEIQALIAANPPEAP